MSIHLWRAVFFFCAIMLGTNSSGSAQEASMSATAQNEFLRQPIPLGQPIPEDADSEVCRVISLDQAELVGGFVTDTYLLSVKGKKPYINMTVRLQPYVYVRRPDYWEIEVVGCLKGMGLPALGGYVVDEWVSNYMGLKGVEVIGSNKTLRFDR